jgi:hypothetical protein
MSAAPKVGDIDDEDNVLTTKIKLTKNEYNATIRNKLEYNRLKVIKRHITDENDLSACKLRTSMHDLKNWLNENQKVVCNIDEFFTSRKVRFYYLKFKNKIILTNDYRFNRLLLIMALVYLVFAQVLHVPLARNLNIERNLHQHFLDRILHLSKHSMSNKLIEKRQKVMMKLYQYLFLV